MDRKTARATRWEAFWHDLRSISGSRYPLAVALFGVAINLISNIATALLEPLVGLYWVLATASISALLLIIATPAVRALLHQRSTHLLLTDKPQPAAWLVVTASLGPGSASTLNAAQELKKRGGLKRVFVLHTDDENGKKSWRAIESALSLKDIPAEPIPFPAAHVHMPERIVGYIEDIYARAASEGLSPDDVLLDYTGGTKGCTAAMTLAGAVVGRRIQYMLPERLKPDGRPMPGTNYTPHEIHLAYRIESIHQHLPASERVDGYEG